MMSEEKKFERLAERLLKLAISMSDVKDLREGLPPSPARQIRHQSILTLNSAIKALQELLK